MTIRNDAKGRGGSIAPPSSDREVVKFNAYERSIPLNSQLVPLTPYLGPGAIVMAAALQRGRTDQEFGQFFHENSQEEVGFCIGSKGSRLSAGDLLIGTKVHGVNAFLSDAHDPESFLLILITQRQPEPDAAEEDQYEGFHIRCQECQELLLREVFSADPTKPEEHGSEPGDRFPVFATVWGCLTGAEKFSADESLRKCTKCGHLNPPFPFETWGWSDYVKQDRLVNQAVESMLSQAEEHLAAAGVAS